MLLRLLTGVASAALLATISQAADLPAYEPAPAIAGPAPAFSWSGFYLGAQVGYGWGEIGNVKPDGVMAGAYAGYNAQLDASPLVLGVETDFNYSDADSKSGGFTFEQRWNGSVRGRVGAAFDRFLVYGAAGFAYADTRLKGFGFKDSNVVTGWTVGGGAEAAVTDNVALRADYRYTDYGSDRYTLNRQSIRGSLDEHRVMGGVSYRFDLW